MDAQIDPELITGPTIFSKGFYFGISDEKERFRKGEGEMRASGSAAGLGGRRRSDLGAGLLKAPARPLSAQGVPARAGSDPKGLERGEP